jgi:hypothetical protein
MNQSQIHRHIQTTRITKDTTKYCNSFFIYLVLIKVGYKNVRKVLVHLKLNHKIIATVNIKQT